jgi:hypothetical protein
MELQDMARDAEAGVLLHAGKPRLLPGAKTITLATPQADRVMVVSLAAGSLEARDGPVLEMCLGDVTGLHEQKEVTINGILTDTWMTFPCPDPDLLRC